MQSTQINKISQNKYAPLRNLFNKNNSKCEVLVSDTFKSFKQVDLYTEDGKCFYALQNGGDVFTAYMMQQVPHPVFGFSNKAVEVYKRGMFIW